jgi:carbamoyl-phosphate synthase large subunit
VIVQLGGQTPLKLARRLEAAGVPIWGTSAAAIHRAEDRDDFHALCGELGIAQPAGGVAERPEEAKALAHRIGYPVMVRPSYVLGGRAMQVVRSDAELDAYLAEVYAELEGTPTILVDDFVEGATELDVDALSDGTTTVVAGIMEHVEGAGVHSGDSACIVPPVGLSDAVLERVRGDAVRLTEALGVRGLINIQFVVKDGEVFVIEANPRASRTVPYLSKAIQHPLAKYAALIAAGRSLADLGFDAPPTPRVYSVKEVVLPFGKFAGVLPLLGPEMRSTGESMGIDADPDLAYYKAQLGAGQALPTDGRVRLIGDGLDALARGFEDAGFEVVRGPFPDPDASDAALLIDVQHTPSLRRALEDGVPYVTTREAAAWTLRAIRAALRTSPGVTALQDLRPA